MTKLTSHENKKTRRVLTMHSQGMVFSVFFLWFSAVINASGVQASSKLENWLNQNNSITTLKNTLFFKVNTNHQDATQLPSGQLKGYVHLKPIVGSEYFKLLKNTDANGNSSSKMLAIANLPEIDFNFVQSRSRLIPDKRTVQRSDHDYWEWLIMPGKIAWNGQSEDYNRAVFPFSLQERNANCLHNGYLTFLIKKDREVSKGYYQITSETCAYLKFDLAGRLAVDFKTDDSFASQELVEKFQQELSSKMQVLSKSTLIEDYPKLKLKQLLPNKVSDSTVSGLVINNKHYQLNCDTRKGPHADCDQLAVPSYSTAKSIFAGIGFMRLERDVPNIKNTLVTDVIPECNLEQWKEVTLNDLLNMRTGNFISQYFNADENSKTMEKFFLSETAKNKIMLACDMFPRKISAQRPFVYHTSDTFLAGVMMQRLYKKLTGEVDLYGHLFADDLWLKLRLSAVLQQTNRTFDKQKLAFTGWGLTYTVNDIIKITQFLHGQNSSDKHKQLLDKSLLAQAMQTSSSQKNLAVGLKNLAYNNGFWALDIGDALGCKGQKWIPFMSGYGGITVAMISKNILYYHFSDNNQFDWLDIAVELNKQFPLCEDIQ